MELLKLKYVCFAIGLLTLLSCTKETPVSPFNRGDLVSMEVPLGSNYAHQVWVNLKEAKVVKTALKSSWDFGFLTKADAPYMVLNTAMSVSAAITNTDSWEEEIFVSQLTFSSDHATGSLDSLRVGKWWEHHKIVVINLGYNSNGNPRGYCKFKGISYSDTQIQFKIANLDGTHESIITLPRNNQYVQNEFSFVHNEILQVSPPKNEYDLVFTGFIKHFYEEGLEYQVVGALLNRFQTSAYRDSTENFALISMETVLPDNLDSARNSIGYDWKYYDFGTSHYEIIPNQYVVKDQNDFFFKIRFIGFYDENGRKGYPTMEIKLL